MKIRCVELVHDELERIIQRCNRAIPEIIRFPNLKEKICEVVSNLLKHRLEPTKEMIKNLINIELDYIDTNHPDLTEFSFEMNMTNVCHTTSKLPVKN